MHRLPVARSRLESTIRHHGERPATVRGGARSDSSQCGRRPRVARRSAPAAGGSRQSCSRCRLGVGDTLPWPTCWSSPTLRLRSSSGRGAPARPCSARGASGSKSFALRPLCVRTARPDRGRSQLAPACSRDHRVSGSTMSSGPREVPVQASLRPMAISGWHQLAGPAGPEPGACESVCPGQSITRRLDLQQSHPESRNRVHQSLSRPRPTFRAPRGPPFVSGRRTTSSPSPRRPPPAIEYLVIDRLDLRKPCSSLLDAQPGVAPRCTSSTQP